SGREGHLGANRPKGRQAVCRAKEHPGRRDARDAESRFGRRRRKSTNCSGTFGTRRREGREPPGSAEKENFRTKQFGTCGTK
ncbi:hypothetical protein KI387_026629, partial [Taxus chinensis]